MAMKRLLGDDYDETEFPVLGIKRNRTLSFSDAVSIVLRQRAFLSRSSHLESLIRKVVREEVEHILCSNFRHHTGEITAPEARKWQLHFLNRFPSSLFTCSNIQSEDSTPAKIVIIDAISKKTITSGPLSSIKLELVVLDGDFGRDEEKYWTKKEFDASVILAREGKRPLLTGDLVISLQDGVGTLGEVSFTDNSSWVKSRTFRVGARVIRSSCPAEGIREARSEAFIVKDHRVEGNKKHYPPLLDDEVWRLEKIKKDGVYHKKLSDEGIKTVQDFLQCLVTDSAGLHRIYGSGLSNKIWEATIQHAKMCVLRNNLYAYSSYGVQLVFNCIYEAVSATFDGQSYLSLNDLTAHQMVLVEKVKQHAYRNQKDMVPFDGPASSTSSRLVNTPNFASGPGSGLGLQVQDGLTTQPYVKQPTYSICNGYIETLPQLKDQAVMPDFLPFQARDPVQRNSFNTQILFHGQQENCVNNWGGDGSMQPDMIGGRNEIGQGSSMDTGACFSRFPVFGVSIPDRPGIGWFKLKIVLKWGISVRKDVAARKMASLYEENLISGGSPLWNFDF